MNAPAKVDVLAVDIGAVFDQAMTDRRLRGSTRPESDWRRIEEARAAVAELIKSDREYDAAAAAHLACTNKPAHLLVTLVDHADAARNRFEAAKARRAAALARVGGAE